MLWSLGQKKSVEYDNHGNQGIFMGILYRCIDVPSFIYTVSFFGCSSTGCHDVGRE